uniref:Ubiquitin-like domain-containing protein n=1 Tax=Ananas comosus var. bracteatus TaxID=296719 RepID=A0A6V7NYE9_ANACO|nr:unnamed protein product [Ananas comosus var. bracteatus]
MAESVELPGSVVMGPEFASEMEITVQSDHTRNYVLLVYGHNTVEDVLVEILGCRRAGQVPKPRLFFNGLELQEQKTLADCGIKPGSVLHLKCTQRVLAQTDDFASPTKKAGKGYADSSSSVRLDGDGEMKIFVQSEYYGNYALEVENANTILEVFNTILPRGRLYEGPLPELYFNGHQLEQKNTLADYGIQDGSILHLEATAPRCAFMLGEREKPKIISGRKKIIITDRPSGLWNEEYDSLLINLLLEQISNGGEENILQGGEDFWCNIAAKFNESTSLQYEHKHLFKRFNSYRCDYPIVNRIRHHPKFSWDRQHDKVALC